MVKSGQQFFAALHLYTIMASTVEELREILMDEIFVDVNQLTESAQAGLPDDREIREEIWLYLLGVTPSSKGMIMEDKRRREKEYNAIAKTCDENGKRISFHVSNLKPQALFGDNDVKKRIKNVLTAYIITHRVEYQRSLAELISPLAAVIQDETNLFSAFCKVMQRIDQLEPINNRCSTCLTMLGAYLPELHQHFEEEEISFGSLVKPWLTGMLVAQIPIEASIQLWDVYLSGGFSIHPYVCMSLLSQMKDALEELNEHEVARYLNYVPVANVDEVLVHADNLMSTSQTIL